MTNNQYNITLTVFFISYALFEPLTNVLLKKLRPSIFIPAIMVAWGIVMVCMGLTHNFAGMVTARFFLGVAEAGLFPGVNFYLRLVVLHDLLSTGLTSITVVGISGQSSVFELPYSSLPPLLQDLLVASLQPPSRK